RWHRSVATRLSSRAATRSSRRSGRSIRRSMTGPSGILTISLKPLSGWRPRRRPSSKTSPRSGSTPPTPPDWPPSCPRCPPPDYDSARQVAWALKSIHVDWRPKPPANDRIVALIGELDTMLKLDPYSSREPRAELVSGDSLNGPALEAALLQLSEAEYRTSLS